MSRSIMFVGTNSSAGKSFFVTAMCRVLSDENYKVSPFKSQNMALNSYIDEDGLEFGRAQAVQAFASRVKPNVKMNPILLKPTSDKKSEIILLGKKVDIYDAKEYYKTKSKYLPYIKKAYQELSDNSDIIVIEGAGSPAEINLLDGDFVNMGMAQIAGAPVILVADIDKGGVFASIYGTIMLTPEKWRKYYKGIIINKFRGDKEILDSGIKEIERLLNVPVLAVMPYIDVDIEEEDSITTKFQKSDYIENKINITIIKLPNISNFTEFSPLKMVEDVNISYISYREDIPKYTDLLIIPASKDIIKDLKLLKDNNMSNKIIEYSKYNNVLAVGNGTYILCNNIEDNNSNNIEYGLGLIDADIKLSEKKTRKLKAKIISKDGIISNVPDEISLSQIKTGQIISQDIAMIYEDDIIAIQKNNSLGIDAFSIFENVEFVNSILNNIRKKKGIKTISELKTYDFYRENQISKLADSFRDNIDIEKIKDIIEKGV